MIDVVKEILGESASASTVEIVSAVCVCLSLGLLAKAICKIFEI